MRVHVAQGFVSRLTGLAGRRPGPALLIPRCRSVHTFGMRFALDLVWLDRRGHVVAVDEGVPPNRGRRRGDAVAVLEVPAGLGSEMIHAMAEAQRNRFLEALDPRVPIYRDTYN